MPKLQKAKEDSNLQIQAMIDKSNRELEINRKNAKAISGKSLNIHEELAHLGGVRILIQSLNSSIQECVLHVEDQQDKVSIKCLRHLRDVLIKEHYGIETWNLVEFMLA